MNIGYRIKTIRHFRGLTQAELGVLIGLHEKNAEIRMSQYENGHRKPLKRMINDFARALNVSPAALTVPDIYSMDDLVHTLFSLEDICGLCAHIVNNRLCLMLDNYENPSRNTEIINMFWEWNRKREALEKGEITKEQYDEWRFNYRS